MKRYEFSFKTITPLMMAGADPDKFELREMSIAGAMRYWYRKLYGAEREKKVFGSTGYRGAFTIIIPSQTKNLIKRLKKSLNEYKILFKNKFPDTNYGRNYLIGMLRNMDSKSVLSEGALLDLTLIVRDSFEKEVLGSLWASAYIGGWGMRSRRGFGSVKIVKSSEVEYFPADIANFGKIWKNFEFKRGVLEIYVCKEFNYDIYKKSSKSFLKSVGATHINGRFRRAVENSKSQKITCPCRSSIECLDLIGWTMMYFRSYLDPDYSTAKYAAQRSRKLLPSNVLRSSFGMPVNFYFSSIKKRISVMERSPSRMFVRIYEKENRYFPVMFFDKSRKNPTGDPDILKIYLESLEKAGFKKVIV